MRDDCAAIDLATSMVGTIEGGIMLSRLTKQEAPLRDCLTVLRTMLTAPRAQSPNSGETQTPREP